MTNNGIVVVFKILNYHCFYKYLLVFYTFSQNYAVERILV